MIRTVVGMHLMILAAFFSSLTVTAILFTLGAWCFVAGLKRMDEQGRLRYYWESRYEP